MKPLKLRDYQQAAIDRILWAQKLDGNDLCVLPTGAGKSIVIAYLAKTLNKPILILQPSKEILEQNYAKLCHYVDADEIGIYSASMNQRDIKFFTFATIQSIYKKPEEFKDFGIVIIDECHGVNPKNLGGMFTSFLKKIGSPKVVGFTATPYRMGLTYLWKDDLFNGRQLVAASAIKLINRMKPMFWSRIIYNINNEDLVIAGYLTRLKYINAGLLKHEEIPVNISQSDFNLEGFEKKLEPKKSRITDAIDYAKRTSKNVLVFCSSVKQAESLQSQTSNSAVVTAKTKKDDREEIITDFKSGKLQVVFNVGVLTTGFDHPTLDCIILLRPTRSIALYYQMLGRGVRIAEGKEHCQIIDLTSTVQNLGRIETIKLDKEEGKWELTSETGHWHNKELYSFVVK